MTRKDVIAALSAHYSAKLNGNVWAGFDDSKRKYYIRGECLPAHPDFAERFPRGWSLLDYLPPAKAREIARSAA